MIPVQRLHSVCVVVRDLAAAARAHSAVYGIPRWRVESTTTHTRATGASPHGVTFQLVQPADGAGFLGARGEGIHALRLVVDPDLDVPALAVPTLDGPAHHLLDTRAALGGWCVELATPDDQPAAAAAEWTLPFADPPPAPITRVWHVGIAVHDIEARMAAYRELLGVADWSVVELRPGAATLDGHPVENAFLVARAPLAGFELELIQPTVEPTHYRELLDRSGEGIHHLLALPQLSDAEWPATRDWMAARGAPVAMSGRVRGGAAEFFYFDTRALLGGYLLEAIVRHGGTER